MKKLDKFVLKSFIGPLVMTFFIVLIILLLQFLWMYVDELAGKGLELKILAELLFQFSLSFVPTALPLAILLAALMTFGNMGEFSELTAIKSSGIPLQRIMRPLIMMISFLVLLAFFFSNYVLPYSNRQARLLLFDIRRKRPDINLQAGSFNNDIDGFSIKVTAKDPVTNRLDGLIIYDQRERRGNVSVTYADSGYIKVTPDETAMIMTLYNGRSFTELSQNNVAQDEKTYPSRKDYFKEQTIVMSLTGFDLERSGNEMFKSSSWMLNLKELTFFVDSLTADYKNNLAARQKEFTETKMFFERITMAYNYRTKILNNATSTDKEFNTYAILDTLQQYDKLPAIERSVENIRQAVNYLNETGESNMVRVRFLNRYKVDWHKKFTLPFACLVFFFIGAPLGAIIRKGGLGTPAVISILFFVIWYVITLSGEKLVEENLINDVAGLWASSYILLPIGIFLTYKATNDSVILNIDTYLAFLNRIKDNLYRLIFQVKNYNQGKNNKHGKV